MKVNTPNFPYLENGRMSGRPTRTLIQFLHQLACEANEQKDSKKN